MTAAIPDKNNIPVTKAAAPADGVLVPLSVAEIKQHIAAGADRIAGMDGHERATLAAKAVGLYLSEGPDNPLSRSAVTAWLL